MNEKQKREAAALRAAIEKAGRGPNGQIRRDVRDRVVSWVADRVAEDVQQRALAAALGIHEATISGWLRARRAQRTASTNGGGSNASASREAAMVEVKLTRRRSRSSSARPMVGAVNAARATPRDLVLVDTSGVRIEGLDVASIVAILRGLR